MTLCNCAPARSRSCRKRGNIPCIFVLITHCVYSASKQSQVSNHSLINKRATEFCFNNYLSTPHERSIFFKSPDDGVAEYRGWYSTYFVWCRTSRNSSKYRFFPSFVNFHHSLHMPLRKIVNQSSMFFPGGILDTSNPGKSAIHCFFYNCDVTCRSLGTRTPTHPAAARTTLPVTPHSGTQRMQLRAGS